MCIRDRVRDMLVLGPGIHDEGVIDCEAGDIDALALEVPELLHVAWQMLGRAGRRKGAGHGKKHDLLAVSYLVRVDRLDAVLQVIECLSLIHISEPTRLLST